MRALAISCVSLVLFGVVACDNGGNAFDTGLPENEPVDQLTDEQAVQACEALQAYVNDLIPSDFTARNECLGNGFAAALTGGSAACESAMADCLAASTTPPDEPQDFMCDTATAATYASCTATVGEVEDCFTVVGQAVDRFQDFVGCDSLANADTRAAIADDLAAISDRGHAACDPIEAAGCPSYGFLFDAIDAVVGGSGA